MNPKMLIPLLAMATVVTGCQQPANQPLDQSRIISVRPAIPAGARQFVERQQELARATG